MISRSPGKPRASQARTLCMLMHTRRITEAGRRAAARTWATAFGPAQKALFDQAFSLLTPLSLRGMAAEGGGRVCA